MREAPVIGHRWPDISPVENARTGEAGSGTSTLPLGATETRTATHREPSGRHSRCVRENGAAQTVTVVRELPSIFVWTCPSMQPSIQDYDGVVKMHFSGVDIISEVGPSEPPDQARERMITARAPPRIWIPPLSPMSPLPPRGNHHAPSLTTDRNPEPGHTGSRPGAGATARGDVAAVAYGPRRYCDALGTTIAVFCCRAAPPPTAETTP